MLVIWLFIDIIAVLLLYFTFRDRVIDGAHYLVSCEALMIHPDKNQAPDSTEAFKSMLFDVNMMMA